MYRNGTLLGVILVAMYIKCFQEDILTLIKHQLNIGIEVNFIFCFNITQCRSRVLCGRNALIVLVKYDCPYSDWLVVWPICLNLMCFLLVTSLLEVTKLVTSTLIAYAPQQGRLRRALVTNR